MYIGKYLLVKYEGKIKKGMVKKIYFEDLDIQLEDGNIVRRKFWEVRISPDEKKED